jgi:uncharacterized Tic20 family protein
LNQLNRPSFALGYYLSMLLILLCVAGAVVTRIWPADEILDIVAILAIVTLAILVLFAIYCAWRARNGR